MVAYPIEPPRELIMPVNLQHGSLVFSGAVFAIVAALALWQVLVKRQPLLLFCVLGGVASVFVEPLCDAIGMIYHPEIGQITAYQALGRKIPWHVVLLLSWYYALFAWLLASPRGARLGRRGFWKLFAGLVVFSTLLEISPTQGGLWKYYGTQPFTISGMPLWWFVANAVSALAGGTLASVATRGSTAWGRWQVMFLMPVGIAGAHLGVALPTYLAMSLGVSGLPIQLAGVVTVFYSLVLMQACARLLFPAPDAGQTMESGFTQRSKSAVDT